MLGDAIGDGLEAVPLGNDSLVLGDEPALGDDGLSGDAAGDVGTELAGDGDTTAVGDDVGGVLGVPGETVGDAGGVEDEDGDEPGDSRAPAAIGKLAHSSFGYTVRIGSEPECRQHPVNGYLQCRQAEARVQWGTSCSMCIPALLHTQPNLVPREPALSCTLTQIATHADVRSCITQPLVAVALFSAFVTYFCDMLF